MSDLELYKKFMVKHMIKASLLL